MAERRVVLAYSGGLDTSVVIHRLASEGWKVIALLVDVGQKEDLGAALARAEASGAESALIADERDRFVGDFLSKALAANALYEGRYPLVSALSRPCIAEALVQTARERSAVAIAHGCTGKGNDQVRFEISVRALAPDLEILAPVRSHPVSREEAIRYAEVNEIPVEVTTENPYSIDMNLWGRTVECGILEDPWAEPPEDAFELTVAPDSVSEAPREIVVGFDRGIPVSVDGEALSFGEVVERVSEIGGRYGFGRVDMIENRRVGIKSREIYEVPGALALIAAHRELEDLNLERDLAHEKALLERRWADLVYDGLWFSPLKEAIDAFIEVTQDVVTGEVRLKFGPGSCTVVGRRSPRALYDESLATYDQGDSFRHQDAEGFVRLFGLGIETWARRGGRPAGETDR